MENETNVVKINEVKTPKNNNKQIINALTVVVIILAVISIHLILNSVIQLEIFLFEGFALVSTNGNIILC